MTAGTIQNSTALAADREWWPMRALRSPVRGFGLLLLAVLGLPLLPLTLYATGATPLGIGVLLLLPLLLAVRALANLSRRLAWRWSGVAIQVPYRQRPRYRSGRRGLWQRMTWRLRDPAFWRDLLWLLVNVPVSLVLGLLPLVFVLNGVWGLVLPMVHGHFYYLGIPLTSPAQAWPAVPLGIASLLAGFAIGPSLLTAHALCTRALLAPTVRAAMAIRVRQLTASRAEAVDAQAAELRRIERDLHDGAQARLVALGMNLGAAEELVDRDPAAAKALLAESRAASARALAELRDLVRGIHPPVLADRGLADAVRALALDGPLAVRVRIELPGRLEAPVESAVYFAVAEALANAAKHGGGDQATVWIRHEHGMLRVQVTDNGRGGADPSGGTGLRGLQRRLATFDGVLTVRSPAGGPTTLSMELPCALSSPRTSSS
jgi:signal transduction histidine kinase